MQTASCDSLITPWEVKFSLRWGKNINLRREGGTGLPRCTFTLVHLWAPPKHVWFFFKKRSTNKKRSKNIPKNQHRFWKPLDLFASKKPTEIWASWLVWLRAKSAAFCAFGATFGARWRCPTRGRQSGCEPRKKKLLLSIILVWLVGILIMVSLSYSIIPMYLGSFIPPQKNPTNQVFFFRGSCELPSTKGIYQGFPH